MPTAHLQLDYSVRNLTYLSTSSVILSFFKYLIFDSNCSNLVSPGITAFAISNLARLTRMHNMPHMRIVHSSPKRGRTHHDLLPALHLLQLLGLRQRPYAIRCLLCFLQIHRFLHPLGKQNHTVITCQQQHIFAYHHP